MNKLILPVAVATFSAVMASTAFADTPGNPGQGFINSGNINACLNSGAGNGGEFIGIGGDPHHPVHVCAAAPTEGGDLDPNNNPNNAPPVPPGNP
jgi:hypothetical protein